VWYAVVDVHVWSERGETDRRGIDLATLKLSRPAARHVFTFARRSPAVGDPLVTIGHPLGGSLTVSRGTLTKQVDNYGKPTLAAELEVEGGSSGGPILDRQGAVVSVVSRIVLWANQTRDGTHRTSTRSSSSEATRSWDASGTRACPSR